MTAPGRTASSLLPWLTGSFSSPAAGNPTGAMVERAYAHHGLHARYVNCEVPPAGLAAAVAGARAMGWIGFNCSLPHKQAVIPLVDDLADSARLIGAVNCVVDRDGRWIGENTDGRGFVEALRTVLDPTGTRVMVLGAGGAARAIAVELALAGIADLLVVNRTAERAAELATVVANGTATTARGAGWEGTVRPEEVDVLVNATSVGLVPGSGVKVDLSGLPAHAVVCDVIPNPPDTVLLQQARAGGLRVLDGRGMLANQAAVNIALWTGVDPDRTVMREALDEAIDAWEHG